jgi:vitamin B12 transporter
MPLTRRSCASGQQLNAHFPLNGNTGRGCFDQQLFTRGTAHLVSFDGVLDQTVGLAYTKFNQRDFDPNPPAPEPSFFNGDRLKADWQGDIKLMAGQVLTLRAEHQRDEITTPIAQITDNAGMIQLQSSLGERFFNATSVRYDSYDTFGGKATFRIAPALLIPETDTKLKGSVGTGFKAPTLSEMFQNFPILQFLREPKPEARDEHWVRSRVRANGVRKTRAVWRYLFPQ